MAKKAVEGGGGRQKGGVEEGMEGEAVESK